ncbi:MAG: response regulator [Alphaproteobacteria bacterium]|nr:response regulator [Alphaproteobacteria bacterium]
MTASGPQSPSPAKAARQRPVNWHVVYYLLAAFDLLAISGSLYLSHQVMGIFRSSVEVNQHWANKLADLSGVAAAAGAVNAPGNDVFDSHDVAKESSRQAQALKAFRQRLDAFRLAAEDVPDVAARKQLHLAINKIDASMHDMTAEADRIFAHFRAGNPEAAGRRMATMDRKFAAVSADIAGTAKNVRDIQRTYFHEQISEATFLGGFEYAFGGIIVLMVSCVLLYGHRIAREFKHHELERAEHTAELEALSARLQDSLTEANSANKAKSDFLSMMSHEIRTPMNGVLGMSAVLMEAGLNGEQQRAAATIRESAESLLRIVNDVLDYSKLDAGAMQIELASFDLPALLNYAAEIVAPRTKSKSVALKVTISDNVPLFVRSDPGRIRQVVLNFLGNAAKFTERGTIELVVSTLPGDHGRTTLRVEVLDTGIGIPADRMHLLFNTFQQTDASISRRFGGTGLGLAISKKLIERLGGRIGAESLAGRGSTFWFEIPIVASTEQDTAETHPGAAEVAMLAAVASIRNLGRPLRLLIAEDNATNLLVAKSVLSKFDIVPDAAGNGLEALEAVRRFDYDVVLMDVHMPEMDGLEATCAIRSLPGEKARVPIVALTANAFSEDVRKCEAAGMNGHVGKPFRKEELIVALANALAARAPATQARSGDTPSEPDAPVVDWTAIESFRADAGEEMLRLLIDTYLEETAATLDKLAKLTGNNTATAEAIRLSHSLKSSSAMAGATALSRLAERMEIALCQDATTISEKEANEMKAHFANYRAALVDKRLTA